MKKSKLWILMIFISIAGLSMILTGCFLGPGFQNVTSGAVIDGHVYGVTNSATVTIKDDLGESTTAASNYYSHHYDLHVKPGVRTITYSCTGYSTVVKKVSVIGRTTVNVTMSPVANGSDVK